MKNILLFIGVLFGFVMLQGCCKKVAAPMVTTEIKEKVETIYTERDTTLFSMYAKVNTTIPLHLLKPGLPGFEKSFKQAKIKGKIEGDQLFLDCSCDTTAITAKLKDKETSKERIVNTVTVKNVTHVPWHVKILAWIGGGSLLVITGWVLRRFKVI